MRLVQQKYVIILVVRPVFPCVIASICYDRHVFIKIKNPEISEVSHVESF